MLIKFRIIMRAGIKYVITLNVYNCCACGEFLVFFFGMCKKGTNLFSDLPICIAPIAK